MLQQNTSGIATMNWSNVTDPIQNDGSNRTLIISGDEDEPCLDASLMLKRHMPSAGLVFMPQTGHACNLEEPEMFNLVCEKFFHQVESGQYRMRDPRATPERIL